VHIALLVDEQKLLGTIERADLHAHLSDSAAALSIATLDGRTISGDAAVDDAFGAMRHTGRRRLAVIAEGATLLGLLCLKASGLGSCANGDVEKRRGVTSA
jgi:CBS domain-containing protein